ncbi:hypothetical protein NPIL_41301 [Nephila pilipes]|uniref:Uncharacterized protein n=1 Tax=Nephila pilipes TaxID=299642 RepID=A0A8X6Q9D8_NEPPI|nr:hypothetical protein NPIL_41301 [Nephila pilipes]
MSSFLRHWRACSRPSCAVVAAPRPEQPLENDGRHGLRFFVPREAECCCLGSSRGYVRSFGDGHCRLRLTGPPPFHLRRRFKRRERFGGWWSEICVGLFPESSDVRG